ncbi:MAG: asparagine synthase-related protein [Gemmatimonadota bacterium]
MRSVYGVAGDVVPGDLRRLKKRLQAGGAIVETLRVPGLEMLLVGRSARDLSRGRVAEGERHALAVGRPLPAGGPSGPEVLRATLWNPPSAGDPATDDWLGEFNLFRVDPVERALHIETDCLGVRPLFVRTSAGRAVFGSDVLPLVEAGLVPSRLDSDALAAWLLLEHPLNGRSLVDGLRRLPPGRARIDLVTGALDLRPFDWKEGDADLARSDLVERIGASVDGLLSRVIRDESRIGSFLSGGYDSRYVACRLAALGHRPDEAVLVDAAAGDAGPGQEVAERLGIPLRIVPVTGSLVDAFEDPWFFAPHGFPQRSFYTSLALAGAADPPPMVDGLLGDDLIRGWVFEQKVQQRSPRAGELTEGLLDAHLSMRPETLFDPASARRLRERVLAQIDAFRPEGFESETRRAWLWVLMHRTRDFHAKNHLQVLDRTETYHPFVTPELISLRLGHRASLFDAGLYEELLRTYCPELEGIPHSETRPRPDLAHHRYSREMRDRTPGLLTMVALQGGKMGLNRSRLAPRLAAYGVGDRNQLYVARPLDRIRVLGARAAAFGAELPWTELNEPAA